MRPWYQTALLFCGSAAGTFLAIAAFADGLAALQQRTSLTLALGGTVAVCLGYVAWEVAIRVWRPRWLTGGVLTRTLRPGLYHYGTSLGILLALWVPCFLPAPRPTETGTVGLWRIDFDRARTCTEAERRISGPVQNPGTRCIYVDLFPAGTSEALLVTVVSRERVLTRVVLLRTDSPQPLEGTVQPPPGAADKLNAYFCGVGSGTQGRLIVWLSDTLSSAALSGTASAISRRESLCPPAD